MGITIEENFSRQAPVIRQLFKSNLLFTSGVIIVAGWILIAIFAGIIAPADPIAQDMAHRFEPPSINYWCGTDELGRDILSRVLVGARLSLMAGLVATLLAGTIGTLWGGIAGYLGGRIDDVMMRFSEMVWAFPPLVLAMTITAALGPSLYNTLLAMVVVAWPSYARIMRSMVIATKENEYVEAAKVLGASHFRILFGEVFANSIGPVLVLATLDLGNMILIFAGLGFLGLGSPPPTPEWGAMVAAGVPYFTYWWMTTFPGLGIFSISLAANFVGDGLRDFLDPKLRKEF